MISRIRTLTRRHLAAGVTAALLAGSFTVPASAPAATAPIPAATRCANPSHTIYSFYSSSTYATKVGQATLDCDGVYTIDYGYQTDYVREKTLACPY